MKKYKKTIITLFILIIFLFQIPLIADSNNILFLGNPELASTNNFEAISESDKSTKWVLTNSSAYEDFHDDIASGYWDLYEVGERHFYALANVITDDAYTSEHYETTNYGSAVNLMVYRGDSIRTRYTYIKYDTSFIGAYLNDNTTGLEDNDLYIYCLVSDNPTVSVYRTTDFDESEITWDNQPAAGALQSTFSATQYSWEIVDLGTTYAYYTLRAEPYHSGWKSSDFYSTERGYSIPQIRYHRAKNYYGSGYAYMQTGTTESVGLISSTYGSTYNLSAGDYFKINCKPMTSNKIELKLYKSDVLQKTITVVPQGNTNYNTRDIEVSVDEYVEFDQLLFTGTLENTKYFKVFDVKTYKYEATAITFYLNPYGLKLLSIFNDNYTLKIYEQDALKVEESIEITSNLTTYRYIPIDIMECRLSLFSQENDPLDFSLFHINITRTLNNNTDTYSLLYNTFTVDVETIIYFYIYDRFDNSIKNDSIVAKSFIDITIDVYSLKISHRATSESSITIETSGSDYVITELLTPEELVEYQLASGIYIMNWTNGENNEFNSYEITLDQDRLLILNTTYHDVYFLILSNDGEAVSENDIDLYINGTRSNLGFNTIESRYINVTIRDVFNFVIYSGIIDTDGITQCVIYLDIHSLNILNLYTFDDILVIASEIKYESFIGHFPATYSFEDEADGTSGEDISFIDTDLSIGAGESIIDIVGYIEEHTKVLRYYDNDNDGIPRSYSNFASQTSGTIEFWVRTTDVTKDTTIHIDDSDSLYYEDDIRFMITDSKLRYESQPDGWFDAQAISNDTWYHIKVVFDVCCCWDLYIDGILKGEDISFGEDPDEIDRIAIALNPADFGYTTYFDAVGYSWDTDYYIGDNMYWQWYFATYDFENDNISTSGHYYGVYSFGDISPEELNHYYGTYSFKNDADGAVPAGWTDASNAEITSSWQNHKKVLNLTKNNGNPTIEQLFGEDITSGTIELYFGSDDVSHLSHIRINHGGTMAILINLYQDKIQYYDGVYNEICDASDDIFYHIRIDFETGAGGYEGLAADTFYVYVDRIKYGSYPFNIAVDHVDKLYFTCNTGAVYNAYYDAIGYSWDPLYNISHNINPFDLSSYFEHKWNYNGTFDTSYLISCTIGGHDYILNVSSFNNTFGHYPATYSFEGDLVGSLPSGWTNTVGGTNILQVIASKNNYKKVLEFYDDDIVNSIRTENFFTLVSNGTIEFWWAFNATEITSQFLEFRTNENGVFRIRLYFNHMVVGRISQRDPDGFNMIVQGLSINTMYHIKIVCDDLCNTFDFYLDEDLCGTFDYYNPSTVGMTSISFETRVDSVGTFYHWLDAIGYSWDTDYYIGDNMYWQWYFATYDFESDDISTSGHYYGDPTSFTDDNCSELGIYYGDPTSFENDAVASYGNGEEAQVVANIDYADDCVIGTDDGYVGILASEEGHKKVLNLTDIGVSNIHVRNDFSAQTSGTVEVWVKGTYGRFYVADVVGARAYIVFRELTNLIYFYHGDGLGGNTFTSIAWDHSWAHIKFEFDTTTDTWDGWKDCVKIVDDVNFTNDGDSAGIIYTYCVLEDVNTEGYYDAIGYSWETYLVGDNINPYGRPSEVSDFIDAYSVSCDTSVSVICCLDDHKKVLNLTDDSASGSVYVYHTSFDASSGTIEFWWRTTNCSLSSLFYLYDESAGTALSLYIYQCNFSWYNGTHWNVVKTAVADTWYHHKIVFDCEAGTNGQFDWYIDCVLEADDIEFRSDCDSLDKLLIGTGGTATGYSVYWDAFGYSWETYTVSDNINPYGRPVDLSGFIDGSSIACDTSIAVSGEFDIHKKFLNLTDNSGTYLMIVYNNFDAQTSGTIELYMKNTDYTKEFYIIISWGVGLNLYVIMRDNGQWSYLTTPWVYNDLGAYVSNQWYHVRVDFEVGAGGYMGLAADTFDLYIDEVLMGGGGLAFRAPANQINKLSVGTDAGDSGYSGYVDAIGYSWDSDYDLYDNIDLFSGSIWNEFESSQTSGTVEFWLYGDDTEHEFKIELWDDTDWIIGLKVNNSNLYYHNSTEWVNAGGLSNDQWYQLRIDFDCDDNDYNLYLDGTYIEVNIPFRINTTSLEKLWFKSYDKLNIYSYYIDAIGYSWEDYLVGDNINPYGRPSDISGFIDTYGVGWETSVNVSGEFDTHKKFISLNDNSAGKRINIFDNFDAQTSGTIEFWVKFTDNSKHYAVRISGTSAAIYFYWDVDGDLKDKDGVVMDSYLADIWYHIRLDFDCGTDTFDIYINQTLKGDDKAFVNAIANINKIEFLTDLAQTDYSFFIDAIAYSWDTTGMYYYWDDYYFIYDISSDYVVGHNLIPEIIPSGDFHYGDINITEVIAHEFFEEFRLHADHNYTISIYYTNGTFIESRNITLSDNSQIERFGTPSKTCFLSYADQRGIYLPFYNYKTYIDGVLIYQNIIIRQIGTNLSIEIKDRYGISIKNSSYVVVDGDNFIAITLTMHSLKIYNQQEVFNWVNVTRDPNYYESEMYWSEWLAPNEITEYMLFEGYYKVNITRNEEGSSSVYDYHLVGDDMLLVTSDNTITNTIINLQNVNTTLGNQITNVEINITNQNSAINNSVVNVNINLSNVNSTLGDLLVTQSIQITNIENNLTSLYIFTNNSFINLNSSINTYFINIENNIISINDTISNLIIGIDNDIVLINTSISALIAGVSTDLSLINTSVSTLILDINNDIILINQSISNLVIDIDNNVALINGSISTLIMDIGNDLMIMNSMIDTSFFFLNTTIVEIGNNITDNTIFLNNSIFITGNWINDSRIAILNNLALINNTIMTGITSIYTAVYLINNSIYTAVIDLGTSLTLINNTITGNLSVILQQNDFLTDIYNKTMFSELLDWSDVGLNFSIMEDRIDVFKFINEYRNQSVEIFLRYQDKVESMVLSAQNDLDQWLPKEDVEYRLKSVATGEYLTKWEEMPENKTIKFGWYEAEVPGIPESVFNQIMILFFFALFVFILIAVIWGLYIKLKRIPDEQKYLTKKPKKHTSGWDHRNT